MKDLRDNFKTTLKINLAGADRPFEPDELPRSLVPTNRTPVVKYNPLEAAELASTLPKTVKMPTGKHPPGIEKRMQNLAQYKGRTPEGNARSVANLVRPVTQDKSTTAIATMPPAAKKKVETLVPTMPLLSTVTGRSLRAVLTSDEWNLYAETWQKWMGAHAEDYTQPEDEQDVHTVCMETVIQFRINLQQLNQPGRDFSLKYQASFNRMQEARKNLTARRVDRVGTKANTAKTVINVAVAAGQVSQELIEQRRQQAVELKSATMQFLDSTLVESEETARDEEAVEAAPEAEAKE